MRENEPVLLVLSVCDGEIILEKGEILCEKCHIIANYARSHFDEKNEQTNEEALRKAHARAAQYYIERAATTCPPREQRRRISDVHDLIEAIWQKCQAGEWQGAYNLMGQESIFYDLKLWGGNAILLELYQLLLPLDKWHQKHLQAAYIYNDLGRLYRTLGQREQAHKYLEYALSICIEEGDRKGEGTALSFLGRIYADLGQREQSRELCWLLETSVQKTRTSKSPLNK